MSTSVDYHADTSKALVEVEHSRGPTTEGKLVHIKTRLNLELVALAGDSHVIFLIDISYSMVGVNIQAAISAVKTVSYGRHTIIISNNDYCADLRWQS